MSEARMSRLRPRIMAVARHRVASTTAITGVRVVAAFRRDGIIGVAFMVNDDDKGTAIRCVHSGDAVIAVSPFVIDLVCLDDLRMIAVDPHVSDDDPSTAILRLHWQLILLH